MKLKTEERLSSFLENYETEEERSRALELINSWEESIGLVLTKEQVSDCYGSIDDKLIELPTSVGIALYPKFQFYSTGILPGLMEVWKQFSPESMDPWGLSSYFMTPQRELRGMTPVEWLRSNEDLDYLLQVVKEYNRRLSS